MFRATKSLLLAASLVAILPDSAQAAPGELTPVAINTRGNNYGYFEYLPRAYDESQDWPVLIFLSGIGENGTGELPQPANACPLGPNYNTPVLCRNLRHGPQNLLWRQLSQGQAGLWNDVQRPFIVIAPQNNAPLFTYVPYNPQALGRFVDSIVENYAVDESRIYLTGMSMGGYSVTLAADYQPERYAAIAIMPGIDGFVAANTCNNARFGFWAFHGDRDTNPFNPTSIVNMTNRYNNCPEPHPTARMTMYVNAGHDVWTRTINTSGMNSAQYTSWVAQGGQNVALDRYNVDLYTWLLQHDKPDVYAGADLVTTSTAIVLEADTIDEDPIQYVWTQLSGAPVDISGYTTATPTISGLTAGTYDFRVQAIDIDDMWDDDTITVTVLEDSGDVGGEVDGGEVDGGEVDDGSATSTTGLDEGGSESGVAEAEADGGAEAEADGGAEAEADGGAEAEADGGAEAEAGDDGGTPSDPLDALDDDFTGNLSQWSLVNGAALASTELSNGSLVLRPSPQTAWHQAQQGAQYFQLVDGNFAVTSQITVDDGNGGPAQPSWRLAGIMLRSTAAGAPSYYHGALGTVGAWLTTQMVFEWKNTVSGATQLGWAPNPSGQGQVRVCRVGQTVRTLYRANDTAAWTVANEQTRADLASTLAVGPMAFSLNSPANFRARFDWVDFTSIASMNDCAGAPVSLLEQGGLGGPDALAAEVDQDAALGEGETSSEGSDGCACSTGGGRSSLPGALLLLGLLGLRRRRA